MGYGHDEIECDGDNRDMEEIDFQRIFSDQGEGSAEEPCIRDAEPALSFGEEEGTCDNAEEHYTKPGKEREVVARVVHAFGKEAERKHPDGGGVDGFDGSARPEENGGRDEVPFAKPQKRDAEDHGHPHHLEEVEEQVPVVANEEEDGEGCDNGNGNADEINLESPFEDCFVVFAF